MTAGAARRLVGVLAAVLLGIGITVLGFMLQRRQIELTMQSQSVKPILDPGRNAAISVCLPVLALGNLVGDMSFGVFLGMSILNVLGWAALIYCVGRWLATRVSREQAA